jgi:tetratricopeptide (TPR) repeat protein
MKLPGIVFSLFLTCTALWGQQRDSIQLKFDNAFENYKFDEAILYGNEWIEKDSSDIKAYYQLSTAYLQKGRTRDAERTLNKALAIDSTHIPTLNQLAKLYRRTDQFARALDVYETLMLTDTLNSYYPREAAELAYPQQQLNKAFHYYQLCLYLDSASVPCYLGLAKLHMDLRMYDKADSLMAEAFKVDSSNINVRLLTAQIHMRMESYQKVVDILEPIFEDANPPLYSYRYYGIALYHTGDYLKSMEVMTALSNMDNELDYPHYYKALCMTELNQLDYAEVQFRQAVNKSYSPNMALYFEQLGKNQQAQNKHKEAIENLRMARKFSNDPELDYYLGLSYDVYYADKSMALELFEAFVESQDTVVTNESIYARSRADEIIKELHFEKGKE